MAGTAAVALAALTMSTLAPAPQAAYAEETVFSDATTPQLITDPDSNAVELGVTFSSDVDITVTGIRFYKGPENTGEHVGSLWDSSRNLLSRVTFADETESGWQEASFDTPVPVDAGETLVAAYSAPDGLYSADTQGFDAPITDGTVTFPEGAGVYTYREGRFPSRNFENSNYYVDVVYTTDPVPPVDPTTPPVDPTTPPVDPTTPPVDPTTPPVDPTTPPVDPTNPPSGAVLDLQREPWWGGPSYYAKFPKANAAGWDDPSFFPISVFFGKPEHAATLANLGVNTYMGAEHDGSSVSTMTDEGISLIAQPEWSPAELGDDPRVVGWHIGDECDMGLGGCDSAEGEYGSLAIGQRQAAEARSHNDGRFLQANFGNGVLGSYWSPETMDDHLAYVDVSSVDKYAYTSTHVQDLLPGSPFWPAGKNPAAASTYGWLQDRMETFSSPAGSKPNWVFVEAAKPYLTEEGATSISGDQLEGAVWNGIIHGAAGIAYFQHNNSGCGNYALLDCGAALQNKVRSVDAKVKSLAPVINTQSYVWNFGPQLETSLKTQGGSAYIFAMTDGSTGTRSFTLPAGLTGNVEVVGEGRTIAVTNGTFTDSFPNEFTHHVYRIALS
ncbi:DUF4082 domain-containing protein [Conyzicola nivalis]|uniref:DUF4082 domain-containing protein n=1 Tax=Conyzicola nivalis TaxID=1477021 RepID=UPI00166E55EB|nr:DUF4082 domain-containing protein [Conyzicola nivalis]